MKHLNLATVRIKSRLFLRAGLLTALLAVAGTSPASRPVAVSRETNSVGPMVLKTFSTGSLIIPMDTAVNGQDLGMLRAYGLVYALLRNSVPVSWVINPAKAVNGDDFTINFANSLQDVRTGASVPSPRAYRGGPFVIAAANASTALPIIAAWQAVPGDTTVVHRLISAGSISADVARTLIRAPRIGILKDGNETIAFNNLNAAGIPDSTSALWTTSSADLLTEADVAGPTTSNHADGMLFAGVLPRYCYVASMHYNVDGTTPEVVQEVRSSLAGGNLTHAFMQCESIRSFENDPNGGYFLTTLGLKDDGSATTSPVIRVPSDLLAQLDGAFQADNGSVDSIGLASGSGFRPGVTTIINDSVSPLLQRIVLLSGRLDGLPTTGRVTYLAGHDYALDLPISVNPKTNGVRLFLNSIFESDCATDAIQADVILTKVAPALINGPTIPYTIHFTNPGPRPVENVTLTDKLPAGTTYVVGSGIPAPTTTAGGVLTWNLPPVPSGGSGTVTFTATVTTDGTFANTAQMVFSHMAVRAVSTGPVITTRDTVPPVVTIISGPNITNNVTPTFIFTVAGSPVSTVCNMDGGPFVPCTSPFTTSPLPNGHHIFSVRVTDAAGNPGSDSHAFEIDTIPPVVTIPGPPVNFDLTNDTTPTFSFIVSDASPTTSQCRIDGDAFVLCTSPFTVAVPLVSGPHSFVVRATDAASNIGSGNFGFLIDTSTTPTPTPTATPVVLVSIDVTPSNPSVAAGLTQPFMATGSFSDGTTQDLTTSVIWSISNGAVATISNAPGSEGLATGLSVGTTQISAQLGSIRGSTNLNVTEAVLVSIDVTPTNPLGAVGYTQAFFATGIFSDGTTRNLTDVVTWSSSANSVATISNASGTKGVATGVSVGTTQVAAQLGSIQGSATLTVTNAVLVSLHLTPNNPSVVAGQTQAFFATGNFSDGTARDLTDVVTWSSSAHSVATISNASDTEGVATGVSAGTTQISAKLGSISGSTTLTVTPSCDSCVPGGFNGTAIGTSNFVWFTANMKPSQIPATGATVEFTDSVITINSTNGVFTYPTNPGRIIFDPNASCATTVYDGIRWVTTVPVSGSDEVLLSAFGFQPTVELKGAKVTWCATFTANQPNIQVNWKYGAAVYGSDMSEPNYNAAGVKPTHDGACLYNNSDHAGTPENRKAFLLPGAAGGGGSNWTGSWSSSLGISVCDRE